MASHSSSTARTTGKSTPLGSANSQKKGSKAARIPSSAGMTMRSRSSRKKGNLK